MSSVCEGLREMMPARVTGELDALKVARLEAHLGNCPACRSIHDQLEGGLSAAREWEPVVSELEVERLVDSMGPYLVEEPRRIGRGVVMAMAACLAAVGAWKIAQLNATSVDEPEPKVVEVAKLVAPAPVVVVRRVIAPRVKVVQSADYRGRQNAAASRLEVDEGFAVFQLEGERALQVVTPNVEIRGMGSRFYVEVEPGKATTLGILAGRATIVRDGVEETIEAGQTRRIGAPGTTRRSAPYHNDLFLQPATAQNEPEKIEREEPRAEVVVATKKSAPRRATQRKPTFVAETALLDAEQLARKGSVAKAIRLYSKIVKLSDGVIAKLARYERARLWMTSGKLSQACREMRVLAASGGEVGVQARLSVCECSDDPCEQQACLRRLEMDPRTRIEAQSMMARTQSSNSCDDHKKDSE